VPQNLRILTIYGHMSWYTFLVSVKVPFLASTWMHSRKNTACDGGVSFSGGPDSDHIGYLLTDGGWNRRIPGICYIARRYSLSIYGLQQTLHPLPTHKEQPSALVYLCSTYDGLHHLRSPVKFNRFASLTRRTNCGLLATWSR